MSATTYTDVVQSLIPEATYSAEALVLYPASASVRIKVFFL